MQEQEEEEGQGARQKERRGIRDCIQGPLCQKEAQASEGEKASGY